MPTPDHISIWKNLVTRSLCVNDATYQRFCERVELGDLTRDENPESHFDVYFLPVNSRTKQVFIVHHKKSGLWLSPGGHIDKGETPYQAVNRETAEELGVQNFFKQEPQPFLFSIVDIDRQHQACKSHFDLWYKLETDGSDFNVDPKEFYNTKWMTIPEAREIVKDLSNLQALDRVEFTFNTK
ncbi:MAG: NUDIX domain-containing protein [Patescibacteria group bacterium]|jgi:8-oxo-dGTP pyrophosphatase MutT (NUDIX family)